MPIRHERSAWPKGWPSVRSSANESAASSSETRTLSTSRPLGAGVRGRPVPVMAGAGPRRIRGPPLESGSLGFIPAVIGAVRGRFEPVRRPPTRVLPFAPGTGTGRLPAASFTYGRLFSCAVFGRISFVTPAARHNPVRGVPMAPERWRVRAHRALALAGLDTPLHAADASALRIVNYNITNHPSVILASRQPHFRTILGPLGADVVVTQEMQSQAGVDSFRTNVLNVIEPGQWLSLPFTNGNDTDNGFFYKPAKVQLVSQRSFYVSVDVERLVNEYGFRPVGYAADAAELRIYSLHLKASTGSANEAQRLREATGLRDTLNALPPGTHAVVMGDYNVYMSSEGAYQKLVESQADNDGRLI